MPAQTGSTSKTTPHAANPCSHEIETTSDCAKTFSWSCIMGDYLRIARVYLRGTTAAVWCFMFFCLLFYSAIGEELARNQGAILGGVLSRKSYMAMFAYFNACILGAVLRDSLAHPWASLLPHYRKKHLLVTMLIALLFLGIPMFSV